MEHGQQRPGFACTDDPAIAASLEAMRQLVVARGGLVHPAACVEARDGSLRVICHEPLAQGQPLFKVPDLLLVSIDGLIWSNSDAKMQLADRPSHLSADQVELLDIFVTIYNCSGKLNWVREQATMVLSRDAEFAAQVDLVRPFHATEAPSAAAAFLKTRSYSSKHAQAGMENKTCIMPLIDFMNHHLDGSKYRHADGWLQIDASYSARSEECFINYGEYRDPLALALGHGYLDPHTPFAHSVPLTLDLAGFGRLQVIGKRLVAKHRADPPKVAFLEDGLSLSHLAGNAQAPHYLAATLRLAMMASGKRRGIAEAVTERALAELPTAILAANRKRLAAFRAYLDTKTELPLASLLSDASQFQLANLEKALAVRG